MITLKMHILLKLTKIYSGLILNLLLIKTVLEFAKFDQR